MKRLTQLLGLLFLLSTPAWAHPEWKEASCIGIIDADNTLTLSIKFDVPPFYLGKTPQAAGVGELDDLMFNRTLLTQRSIEKKEAFLKTLILKVDGVIIPLETKKFPTAAEIKQLSTTQGEADRYPVLFTAEFSAQLPKDARKLELIFPPDLGNVFTNLRKEMNYQVVMNVHPNEVGELNIYDQSSSPFTDKLVEIKNTTVGLFKDGFGHVIPEGWDHCLFMLAMFLGASSLGQALKRSLIFTFGHSVTLTLVVLGIIPHVGDWIEPLIALTIGVGALLAYWGKASNRQMLAVPVLFGLIHGLGFAAAVSDNLQTWDKSNIVKILIGFNIGVELAQATVILSSAMILTLLVRLKLSEIPLRRTLCAAVAVAGFGVMLSRIWELLH